MARPEVPRGRLRSGVAVHHDAPAPGEEVYFAATSRGRGRDDERGARAVGGSMRKWRNNATRELWRALRDLIDQLNGG